MEGFPQFPVVHFVMSHSTGNFPSYFWIKIPCPPVMQSVCCLWLRSFCSEPTSSFGVRRETTERTPTTNWAENSRENLGLFFFRSSRYSYKLNGAQGRRGKHASRRGRAKQRNPERPEKQGEF